MTEKILRRRVETYVLAGAAHGRRDAHFAEQLELVRFVVFGWAPDLEANGSALCPEVRREREHHTLHRATQK